MQSKFTNSKVKQFRDDFQNAVLELEKKYEVTIKLGTLTYDSTSVRGKMTALIGDRSNVLTKEDFKVGDKVKISHKKILPDLIFEIQKINNKNIKVICTSNVFNIVTVSPSLLRKI
jgi:hypothetical protein